ncbi:MAG: hypothetical protein HY777_09730 [Betaproteobacteria bacterium]|nr:hypothetical protein [Betaproteobacteria bacterium]
MLNKRLIGVITVKDGWAVQSFAYRRYLPLGRPECLAENLDRWGVDEILILSIDRSGEALGPDIALLQRLGALGLSTPMIYGGGIHRVQDAAAVIQSGAERICLDAALRGDPQIVREMAELLGTQALIGVLPLSCTEGKLAWYDYLAKQSAPLATADLALFAEGIISEALLVDWRHEGGAGSFEMRLIEHFPLPETALIAFGGLSEATQFAALFSKPQVSAAAIGNFLSYREHAVQSLKKQLGEFALRPPIYAFSIQ